MPWASKCAVIRHPVSRNELHCAAGAHNIPHQPHDRSLTAEFMSSRLNGAWHQKHPMPKNPTLEERVDWHLAHNKACGCREIPETVLAELRRRGQTNRPSRPGAHE
jgi:hypothetical protein